jgi:hypothetical protein
MTTIVSYSEVFKWQTCQRQYYYRFILGLAPIEESAPILTGIKGHKLLQYFYELIRSGKPKSEAHLLTTQHAKKIMDEEKIIDISLLRAWTLVDNYIRDNDFTSEALLIENRFLLPVSTLTDDPDLQHVSIGFTPDVVFQRKGNKIDVEDSKFIQRKWSKSKLERFPQTKLYQIFLEKMGYNISRSLIRFFNVTTAEISIQPYTLTKIEANTLIHDFLCGVKEVVRYKEGPSLFLNNAPRTMNYTACQFCAFEFPCTLEAEGKDATKTFKNLYTMSQYDYNR